MIQNRHKARKWCSYSSTSEVLLDLRETVFIRYSLFDLSKIYVYSIKGEFLCVARQVEKVHPMANHLGTVKDIEEFKQRIQKQKRQFNKAKKEFLKYYPTEDAEVLEIEREPVDEIAPIFEEKRRRAEGESISDTRLMRAPKQPKRERKQTPREQQMNRPIFTNDAEKYEWLIAHGCTNQEDRQFLTKFIQSEQYQLLYADCEQRAENGNGEFSFVDPFNASNQEGD